MREGERWGRRSRVDGRKLRAELDISLLLFLLQGIPCCLLLRARQNNPPLHDLYLPALARASCSENKATSSSSLRLSPLLLPPPRHLTMKGHEERLDCSGYVGVGDEVDG
jgi:hypothetical protein